MNKLQVATKAALAIGFRHIDRVEMVCAARVVAITYGITLVDEISGDGINLVGM